MADKEQEQEVFDDFQEGGEVSVGEGDFTDKGSRTLDSEKYFSDIDELDRLGFAKMVLLFLFILVVVVFICSYLSVYFAPENEKLTAVVSSILDMTKIAIPSIVTLVLGFYFGKKD